MNEEEVKYKIVLPWLESRGIDPVDIRLESSFRVHIGRRAVLINGRPISSTVARPRLDILVTHNGSNLLVVEAKASDVSLTESDRDQAVSYARLLHPIAPYALVTNGTDFELYDSISRNLVEDLDVQAGSATRIDNERRVEALNIFFRSADNLIAFSQQQVTDALSPLRNPKPPSPPTFSRDLHVPRSRLTGVFDDFLGGSDMVFALLGESGMGKTSSLCHFALKLLSDNKPVVFLRGVTLAGRLVDALAEEFHWIAESPIHLPALISRLDNHSATHPLVIIVDGLDEWAATDRAQQLSTLSRHLSNHNVRLVVGCKTDVWTSFVSLLGAPTGLGEHTYTPSGDSTDGSMILGGFSSEEFTSVVRAYRESFGFSGAIERSTLDDARRNPFLLRLLFAAAHSTGAQQITYDSLDLFEMYRESVFAKTSDPSMAERQSVAIASFLLECNSDRLLESDVRKHLQLRIQDRIMPDLYSVGVLDRGSEGRHTTIGFSFQQFRDYLLAFHVKRWDQQTPSQFYEDSLGIASPSTAGDALRFFYRLAREPHRRALDGLIHDNALKYLQFYREVLQHHVPALSKKMPPETDGVIGFVAEFLMNERRLGAYGFRAVAPDEPEILFLPVSRPFVSDLPYVHGADLMHFSESAGGFRELDVKKEVLSFEVCEAVWKLTLKHQLDESACPELLADAVLTAVAANPDIFRPHLEQSTSQLSRPRLPLQVQEIRTCLLQERLRDHFREVWVERERKAGRLKEHRRGRFASYSISRQDYAEWVENKVEQAVGAGEIVEFRCTNIETRKLQRRLEPALDILETLDGTVQPREGSFTLPENSPDTGLSWAAFSAAVTRSYELFLTNYRRMVERNFPSLRHTFKLYSQMPVAVFLEFGEFQRREPTPMAIHYAHSPDRNRVAVCRTGEVTYDRQELVHNNQSYPFIQTTHTSWDSVRSGSFYFEDSELLGRGVRMLVYARLRNEVPNAMAGLLRECGVEDDAWRP